MTRYSNGNYIPGASYYPFRTTSEHLEIFASLVAACDLALADDMVALAVVAKDPDGDRVALITKIRATDLGSLANGEREKLAYLLSRLERGYEFAQ